MNYFGTLEQTPTELELANRALAREAAAEGFVLLKNDGALPLKSQKIALYGMGARKTVKGGLGSGSVEERYSINIEDGLKNAGYEITSKRPCALPRAVSFSRSLPVKAKYLKTTRVPSLILVMKRSLSLWVT